MAITSSEKPPTGPRGWSDAERSVRCHDPVLPAWRAHAWLLVWRESRTASTPPLSLSGSPPACISGPSRFVAADRHPSVRALCTQCSCPTSVGRPLSLLRSLSCPSIAYTSMVFCPQTALSDSMHRYFDRTQDIRTRHPSRISAVRCARWGLRSPSSGGLITATITQPKHGYLD